MKEKGKYVQSYCKVEHIEELNMSELSRKTNKSFANVVEPQKPAIKTLKGSVDNHGDLES